MSYTYLLEQGEESLAASYSDIPLSVLSRLNLTQEKCCSKDSETASCQSSQYGMMSARSTEYRGEDQLMFFAEDSLAKTSLRRVKEQELPESVRDYGKSMRELLEKSGLSLSLPKTHLCFALGDLELSSKTWPRWGMTLDGELSELGLSVRHISETECGSWPTNLPTPLASDHKKVTGNREYHLNRSWDLPNKLVQLGHHPSKTGGWGWFHPSVSEWMMGWPIGWTDLKPLETGKFQAWQHSHGEPFHNEKIAATPGEQEAR
jgi:hypothetical protein